MGTDTRIDFGVCVWSSARRPIVSSSRTAPHPQRYQAIQPAAFIHWPGGCHGRVGADHHSTNLRMHFSAFRSWRILHAESDKGVQVKISDFGMSTQLVSAPHPISTLLKPHAQNPATVRMSDDRISPPWGLSGKARAACARKQWRARSWPNTGGRGFGVGLE